MSERDQWFGNQELPCCDEITQSTRAAILIRDWFTCRYCGDPASTKDHVIPRSRGGSDRESNLVACCSSCNVTKGNRTPDEAKMPMFW